MIRLQASGRRCRQSRCDAPATITNYCEAHEKQRQQSAGDVREAEALLHTGSTLDNQMLQVVRFRPELKKLQVWWDRALEVKRTGCDVRHLSAQDSGAVVTACIARARELIMADRGQLPIRALGRAGRILWKRFENLEHGLHSDGRPRTHPLL